MTENTPTRRDFVAGSLAAGALLASERASAQPADPVELSIGEAAGLIRTAAISPTELVTAYLDRIERLDPAINSYITVTAELALEQARTLEAELAAGRSRGRCTAFRSR